MSDLIACGRCQGSGFDDLGPCPRCESMPKLAWGMLDLGFPKSTIEAQSLYGAMTRGWFRPDPARVVWWCAVLDRSSFPVGCGSHPSCGWVSRPRLLEEESNVVDALYHAVLVGESTP